MDYILKIKNQSKAKSLLNFLKNLDFVQIEKHDLASEMKQVVKEAEKSKSISLNKARTLSEKWKG
jgi:hypothetical protein